LSANFWVVGLARRLSPPVLPTAAALIDQAMDRLIAEQKCLTPDLGGSASTQAMGDAVANLVRAA
jgi:isocitrate/isopropylmalate dehydrogenase